MRIDYQIYQDGKLKDTDISYDLTPPAVGEQITFQGSPVRYDVEDVKVHRDHNDDEDTTNEYAVVRLKIHLPNLDDIIKPIDHDGPCYPVKLSDDRVRDSLTTEVMRRSLTLNVDQLQQTLIFMSSL